MLIIGISGKIGCGKSTLGVLLMAQLRKRNILMSWVESFADRLKIETAQEYRFPIGWAYNQVGKMKRIRTPDGRNITVREALQELGFERRAEDPDYWVKLMDARLKRDINEGCCTVCIIDDVRMPNEASMVRRYNGIMVRLDPYPGWRPGPNAGHESETALDDYTGWDFRFAPEKGALDAVAEELAGAVLARMEGDK